MTASRTTVTYQRKHPTSRKAVLRAVFEVFGAAACVQANRLLATPVATTSLRIWFSRWRQHNALRREP